MRLSRVLCAIRVNSWTALWCFQGFRAARISTEETAVSDRRGVGDVDRVDAVPFGTFICRRFSHLFIFRLCRGLGVAVPGRCASRWNRVLFTCRLHAPLLRSQGLRLKAISFHQQRLTLLNVTKRNLCVCICEPCADCCRDTECCLMPGTTANSLATRHFLSLRNLSSSLNARPNTSRYAPTLSLCLVGPLHYQLMLLPWSDLDFIETQRLHGQQQRRVVACVNVRLVRVRVLMVSSAAMARCMSGIRACERMGFQSARRTVASPAALIDVDLPVRANTRRIDEYVV